MKKRKDTAPEWERRISAILDKSRNDLLDINARYERQSKHEALCNIENRNHCGHHERRALEVFHNATSNVVPLSRLSMSSDDDLRALDPRINKYVGEKAKQQAIAIDALRDQISSLKDDIHKLNRDNKHATTAVATQEKRLDVISHEFDVRHENLSNIEAVMLSEKDWQSKIEAELGVLMQSTRQQQAQIANKADLTILEAAKSETNETVSSAVSNLQTSFKRDVRALRESLKDEVSQNIHPLQVNLMETLKEAVRKETKCALEDELERLQSCIESFNKSKGKVQAFVTSAVETAETNLRGDIELSLKDLKRLQKEVNSLKRSIRDDVGSDLTSIKEEVAKVTLKQSEFIPTLNSSIESSRREVSDKMKEGLKQIEANVASRTKIVDDILAGIKSQIEDIQTQQEEVTTRQAGDIAKLFERVAELETNLLKLASRQWPYDETMLSEKVASLVNPKIEKLESMIDSLEKSSMVNIKESEVWQEAKKLVEEESASDALNISREERNRTLSEVAKKVLAVAARRGDDPSLLELSRIMQDGKIGTTGTPYHNRRSQEVDDSSPESQMSILTSEALSLCNVKLDDDTQTETPRSKESCPSPTPSCLDSVLNRSTPEVNGPKESDISKLVESRSPDEIFSSSKSVAKEEDDQQTSPKVFLKEEESSGSSSTPEGSITSFDNVFEMKNNKAADHGYNPTRLSNPEPYKGWDSLLTELRASGLILRDGDDVSPKEEAEAVEEEEEEVDDSSCSYGSASFDSSYKSEEE